MTSAVAHLSPCCAACGIVESVACPTIADIAAVEFRLPWRYTPPPAGHVVCSEECEIAYGKGVRPLPRGRTGDLFKAAAR